MNGGYLEGAPDLSAASAARSWGGGRRRVPALPGGLLQLEWELAGEGGGCSRLYLQGAGLPVH